MKAMRSSSQRDSSQPILVALVVVCLALVPAWRTLQVGDPLRFMYPNFLLFFTDADSRDLLKATWNSPSYSRVDAHMNVDYEPTHVPVITRDKYNWETFHVATEGFTRPAVVRGLFADSPALTRWSEPGYLSSRIGSYEICVIHNATVGNNQRNKSYVPFDDAMHRVLSDEKNEDYLFFPTLSRSNNVANNQLVETVNRVVLEDLALDKRIWPGFGTSQHSTFYGSQLIIGRGKEDSEETTGTGWHNAIANNFFVQVIGRKRWYFLDPSQSSFLKPLRGGLVNMMAGDPHLGKKLRHLPGVRYVDVEPGDLLYNPPWAWHTIKNYPGLSIGVPIQEANLTLSFQNNFLLSSVVAYNQILVLLGFHVPVY